MALPKLAEILKINPRRPLDHRHPDGYQESDVDFVCNNLDVCVKFLEGVLGDKIHAREGVHEG